MTFETDEFPVIATPYRLFQIVLPSPIPPMVVFDEFEIRIP